MIYDINYVTIVIEDEPFDKLKAFNLINGILLSVSNLQGSIHFTELRDIIIYWQAL